ncbi:MAG TPA: putative Ig domain-containing protein [Opitutaceae bacterium]|jgi:alpha-galactosidase|nr:putative Ig domain-containing protein [Opitutaceae bacterium]
MNTPKTRLIAAIAVLLSAPFCRVGRAQDANAEILTPAPAATPHINGPSVFGARPGSPFLYRIPATGVRPIEFSADHLPGGLTLDAASGVITGSLSEVGRSELVLHARNSKGEDHRNFAIVIGESIALTPAMGWNSWNCWADSVDQEKVTRSARALVSSGLSEHGWTYVNIDDTWQGMRSGEGHALQANAKFPDIKGLCDTVHGLGLKMGIYSTPWVTSYAGFVGGSSDNADGAWSQALGGKSAGRHLGKYSFANADARQWAQWGFDYLKYDWKPNDLPHIIEMSQALRKSGRDILFSLSNAAPYPIAADLAHYANSWRTTGDIRDVWTESGSARGFYGVSELGFSQDRWAPYAAPGHWNDPDMLVVGYVGWSAHLHPTQLTAAEQYSHISLWCMLSAPLLLGCDLERLDPFTLGLLTNDEVLALDQDALGRQAVLVATAGSVDVYMKDLEDGSKALGFFNRDTQAQTLAFGKLARIGFSPKLHVRDLWREKDLPDIMDSGREDLNMTIPAHGVMLYKVTSAQ